MGDSLPAFVIVQLRKGWLYLPNNPNGALCSNVAHQKHPINRNPAIYKRNSIPERHGNLYTNTLDN